jgi:hypothetical protein
VALCYYAEKCAVPLPYTRRDQSELERLVFASQTVEISSITAENLREWIVRVVAWDERFGTRILGPGELGILERWIGLETNVSDKSRDEWLRRLTIRAVERGEMQAEKWLGVQA